jgi:phosphocarrier protein HPr
MSSAEVIITHDVGLHARPSVKLTKLAKNFVARIDLALGADGPWVDAKSIVKVMATRAPKGATLFLRAEGDDAEDAIAALVSLVQRDFDEGAGHAQPV